MVINLNRVTPKTLSSSLQEINVFISKGTIHNQKPFRDTVKLRFMFVTIGPSGDASTVQAMNIHYAKSILPV